MNTTVIYQLPYTNIINTEFFIQLTNTSTNDDNINDINEINEIYKNFLIQLNNDNETYAQKYNQIEPIFRSRIISLLVKYDNELCKQLVIFEEIQPILDIIHKILNNIKILFGINYMIMIYFSTCQVLNHMLHIQDNSIKDDLLLCINIIN
jgi:hypothetical protein